jgi:hypothetical protein
MGGLLFSGQVVGLAEAADDLPEGASTSPSDQPLAPPQPTPVAAKAPPRCSCETCCTRRGRLRIRARRLCRSRCVPCQAGAAKKADPYAWKDLFDGKTLTGWKVPEFGGDGEVHVEDGAIVMEMGASMTGITYTGEVPRTDYEVSLEGARIDGVDFFCTTTFPVGKDPCSFVVGGWGGGVVGLSNVDYYDAYNNPTATFHDFKKGQWYKVRIRVTEAKIEAWIDDEQVVDQPREGHKIDIRYEVELCKPLGIATWVTKGAVRNIRLRKLKPEEAKPQPSEEK